MSLLSRRRLPVFVRCSSLPVTVCLRDVSRHLVFIACLVSLFSRLRAIRPLLLRPRFWIANATRIVLCGAWVRLQGLGVTCRGSLLWTYLPNKARSLARLNARMLPLALRAGCCSLALAGAAPPTEQLLAAPPPAGLGRLCLLQHRTPAPSQDAVFIAGVQRRLLPSRQSLSTRSTRSHPKSCVRMGAGGASRDPPVDEAGLNRRLEPHATRNIRLESEDNEAGKQELSLLPACCMSLQPKHVVQNVRALQCSLSMLSI